MFRTGWGSRGGKGGFRGYQEADGQDTRAAAAAADMAGAENEHTGTAQQQQQQRRKKTRRVPAKKVSRACVHCRNAHITCDDSRPCRRCVKKGLQDSCVDAPRKIKKYLLGTDEVDQLYAAKEDLPSSVEVHIHVDGDGVSSPQQGAHQMAHSASLPANMDPSEAGMRPPSYVPSHTQSQFSRLQYTPGGSPDVASATATQQSVPQYMNTNTNMGVNLGTNVNMGMNMNMNMNTNMNMNMSNMGMKTTNDQIRPLNYLALSGGNHSSSQSPDTPPSRRMDFSAMSNGFIRRSPSSNLHLNSHNNHGKMMYDSIDSTMDATNANEQADIDFLSSAADSEYAILGNIIDQTMFQNNGNGNGNNHNSTSTSTSQKYVSPALSTTSDDFEYLNYQPLMAQNSNDSPTNMTHMAEPPRSPFVKPLQPIEMRFQRRTITQNDNVKAEEESADDSFSDNSYDAGDAGAGAGPDGRQGRTRKRKLKYSDLYPDKPQCDTSTNQYFIGTMSTIDGIKTHTFPEVVKQIAKFKSEHPKKFRERNRRSAISFSIGILDDVVVPEIEGTDTTNEDEEHRKKLQLTDSNENSGDNNLEENGNDVSIGSNGNNNSKCGLLYHEPCEIYAKVKQPFTYVKPYHDLNLYLKSRFPKEDLVQMSKSIAEYRPSFIAGMIKLKEDDLIFAEQCFQRTLLEYDGYIGISGTPTLVWRRSSQIAYVGDEFCILTGWSKDNLLGKSTFAVEIMDDRSCVEYFKIFSKIAFGDMSGDTITECTLLTPKGESIRTNSTWTLKRDVFGIPMMIIATFLPILT